MARNSPGTLIMASAVARAGHAMLESSLNADDVARDVAAGLLERLQLEGEDGAMVSIVHLADDADATLVSRLCELEVQVAEARANVAALKSMEATHKYNEIKDAAEEAIGQLTMVEGLQLGELDERFGISDLRD